MKVVDGVCADCGEALLEGVLPTGITVWMDARVETVEVVGMPEPDGPVQVACICPGMDRPGESTVHGAGCRASRLALHDFTCRMRPPEVPSVLGDFLTRVH